jgi:putative ABC transport system permease protein
MNWLRRPFHKSRAESDLDKELRFHLEQQTVDEIAAGASPEEARRRVRLEFGGLERVKEEVRDTRWETHLDNLMRDFRYALRNLGKDRRFSLVAILTLALGIGSTTVIFSVVDCVLLHPFPYKDVDRLATFHIRFPSGSSGDDRYYLAAPEFLAFQQQNHVFSDMIGLAGANVLYAGKGATQRLAGGLVTPNAFAILGIPPLLGRPITLQDAEPASPPVFAMSYVLWVGKFNRDPKLLNTTFILNGQPRTLVAIMPPRFQFGGFCELWIPASLAANSSPQSLESGPWFWPVGVLKPGVSLKSAAADFNVIAGGISKTYPAAYLKEFGISVESFTDYNLGDLRNLLFTLVAAVTLLLLIACSNVANLLFSRATARAREIAIRASIGASRARLVQQLLVESFVLAIAGCLLGCWFAYFSLRAVAAAIPAGTIPAEAVIRLSPQALWFALATTVLSTLLAGMSPLLHAIRGDISLRLAGSGKRAGSSDGQGGKLRAVLVVGEVALSILLLTGAGLMVRTLLALQHAKLGFDPANVLCAQLHHSKNYDSPAQKNRFYRSVLSRLQAIPGVTYVAESVRVPPYSVGLTDVLLPGKTSPETSNAISELCSEDYFKALGIPLLAGRIFSKSEVDSARHVVVVNQLLARSIFPGEDPIGRKIKFPSWEANYSDWPRGAYFEIIGVVGDAKNKGVRELPAPQIYLPYTITATGLADDRAILVKVAGAAEVMLPSVQRAIHDLDPGVAVTDTGTIATVMLEDSYERPRLELITVSSFAIVGLLLVACGIFSVISYTVSLQTHEIGLRMALGAQQGQISRMVLSEGFRLIGMGIFIGIGSSLALTRLIASQIWGVSLTDPLTYAAVLLLIILVGLAACLLPARRAAAVDPLVALRYE